MNTTQIITQQDVAIIKAHKEQFAKPLLLLEKVSRLDLPQKELEQNKDFQWAISELKEIDRQGYKRQLKLFSNMVYGGDIF